MIRVCPHSDSQCRHGMACTFSCETDQYDGTKKPMTNDTVTVPREPTESMLNAGANAPYPCDAKDVWAAMLAAAPPSAVPGDLRAEIDAITDRILPPVCDTTGCGTQQRAQMQVDLANAILALLPARPAGEEGWLLDALRENSWDLRCFDMPTGGGDSDIGWRVVGHWHAEACERTVAEVYSDDPAAAIRAALRQTGQEG